MKTKTQNNDLGGRTPLTADDNNYNVIFSGERSIFALGSCEK